MSSLNPNELVLERNNIDYRAGRGESRRRVNSASLLIGELIEMCLGTKAYRNRRGV